MERGKIKKLQNSNKNGIIKSNQYKNKKNDATLSTSNSMVVSLSLLYPKSSYGLRACFFVIHFYLNHICSIKVFLILLMCDMQYMFFDN